MHSTTQMQRSKQQEVQGMTHQERPTYVPRLDILESDTEYSLALEMPGVASDDVDITLEEGILTVVGHARELGYDGYELHYGEFEMADYRRSLRLTEAVNAEGIDAQMHNGILRITLPKSERLKPRKITVKTV